MTTKMFNSCKADIKDIFKYVLNNDVANHIASYISHPIHEYFGVYMLLRQKTLGLRLTWRHKHAYKSVNDILHTLELRWNNCGYKSLNDIINDFGYLEYEQMRNTNIKIMNNVGDWKGLARPYLPVQMLPHGQPSGVTLKKDIMEVLKQNGLKVYKSWTKQKMVNHYYKSIV